MVAPARGRAVWTRVSAGSGQVLDLLHARVTEEFAPHVHEPFAFGAVTEGAESIGYRGGMHYAGRAAWRSSSRASPMPAARSGRAGSSTG